MKKSVVLLFILLISRFLFGQSYEEWLKEENKNREKFKEEEKSGIQKLQKEYDAFVIERDKEFAEFLKQRWVEFEVFSGQKREIIDPKPKDVPVAIQNQMVVDVLLKAKGPIDEIIITRDTNICLRVKKSEQREVQEIDVVFDFYGNDVVLLADKRFMLKMAGELNESFFSSYWLEASKVNYDDLLDCLFDYKYRLGLNDWGYYMLIRSFSEKLLHEENERQLLCWFLLNKSGYAAGLGYGNGDVAVLLPTMQSMYSRSYILREGIRYYIMGDLKQLKTYEGNFEGSNRLMDLRFKTALNFSNNQVKKRRLVFEGCNIEVAYNGNTIDFYNNYPSTELSVYFNAPFSSITKESLSENLYPILKGQSKEVQIGKLLSFLHKSFPYQTDEEQFGREKYFFPEEILAYPYSDCEDRSVFFSSLVKLLVGLPGIGLSYPGHVSTAIKIDSVSSGGFVKYQDERYVSCDPTYMGASIGMSMPNLMDLQADVVEISMNEISREREAHVLSMVQNAGGGIVNTYTGMARGENGFLYVTGVFSDHFQAGDQVLKNATKGKRVFLAQIDKKDRFTWALALEGDGIDDMPQQLKVDKEGVLLAGIFQGTARIGQQVLRAGDTRSVFVVNVDQGGHVKWVSHVATPTEIAEDGFCYAVKFNERGRIVESHFQPLMLSVGDNNMSKTRDHEWVASGMYTPWKSFVREEGVIAKREQAQVDISVRLKSTSDALIKEDVDASVAGLFAVVSLINDKVVEIKGKDVIAAFDRYNPSFKNSCPNIYENIKRVAFIRGNDGYVEMKTTDGKPVNFAKMKMQNGCRMRLSELPKGHMLMEIMDGMSVGKAFIWYKLNSVRLYRDTGNIVFDYDNDHTLKTFNLSKDILGR